MNRKEKKIPVNSMDIDSLLTSLKPIGRFQLTQYFIISTCFIAAAASYIKLVFVATIPGVTCTELNNSQLNDYGYETNKSGNIKYETCHIEIYNRNTSRNETLSCINGYTYSTERDASIVSEWDLVCENGALSEFSQTLYAIGSFLGSIIVSILADKFGRKPAHLGCLLLVLIIQLGEAAVQNFWLFAFLRLIEGFVNYGMFIPAFSLMLELFPGSRRTLFAALTGVLWAVGMFLLTPIAYACRFQSWRIACIVLGSLPGIFFFEFWFIEDSIRWLLTNNKLDAARKVVKRAAKENGVNFDEVWTKCIESSISLVPLKEENGSAVAVPSVIVKELSIMTIIKDPLARSMSLILVYNAMLNSLTYYGIYMIAVELAGNYYLNFVLTSCMEVSGNIAMFIALTKFDRRTTMFFFQLFSGCSLIIAVIIIFAVEPNAATIIANKVFTLLGMFGISASFCVLWLYAPEIYPTNLRNCGLGLLGMGSALGNIISPFSRYAVRHLAWLPATVFGVGAVIGSFLLLTLPESKGVQMPTTMDDVRAMRKKRNFKKGFHCST